MATVKQLDKRSGITYVYESVSYWDKEKKQPRSKRTLAGRLDTATGTIVPTDGRGKRRTQKEPDPVIRKGPVPTVKTERLFFGATYLLDQIGEETGVTADLKTCFPNHYMRADLRDNEDVYREYFDEIEVFSGTHLHFILLHIYTGIIATLYAKSYNFCARICNDPISP